MNRHQGFRYREALVAQGVAELLQQYLQYPEWVGAERQSDTRRYREAETRSSRSIFCKEPPAGQSRLAEQVGRKSTGESGKIANSHRPPGNVDQFDFKTVTVMVHVPGLHISLSGVPQARVTYSGCACCLP